MCKNPELGRNGEDKYDYCDMICKEGKKFYDELYKQKKYSNNKMI